jgi:hypothetical protein
MINCLSFSCGNQTKIREAGHTNGWICDRKNIIHHLKVKVDNRAPLAFYATRLKPETV